VGDSWDAVYFFTRPAFFDLFAVGFTVGFYLEIPKIETVNATL
jgi:hypothetical protein